jgi:uncharacterized protein YecE (DUF72 family)
MSAYVGCSGWSYREWAGRFYPDDVPASRRFEFYASRFGTVELNSTFYRLPSVKAVRNWAQRAPEGFVYAVKLGAFGTHRKRLADSSGWLPNHLERVRELGSMLGPTLVQLPPRWKRDTGRIDDFLATATSLGVGRLAVELRDPSWIDESVFATLERHGAALVLHDMIEGQPWRRTTDWTYLRFHGPKALTAPYRGEYGRRRLATCASRVRDWSADGDLFAYFNNDVDAAAPVDAARFAELLGDRDLR